ncbi:MAG: prolipoprotein diacylglyceryl transferase [Planctomycetaceae bacterium]|jgi:phosphatidylglycerol:prolipoprotein diacylglycerol transferase|nr:prolipoprotein diacylglyceryl transferase [Planctomycetaceae bacterium]
MRQTLFYIPPTLNGIPVFGFGIVLAIFSIFILAAAIWRLATIRKVDGELISYLLLAVVIGFVLVGIAPNILESQGFPIRGYGVCLLFAILSAIGLAAWLGSSRGFTADIIISLGFWVTICGIIGTRIFYVIEYRQDMIVLLNGKLQLLPTLYNIVNIANGGLVVIGGIIGGALGGIIFALKNKYNVLVILDIIVPTVMLGIAIGRIGCFLNGCCFGAISEMPWAVTFPEGSPAHICQIERGDTTYCGLKFIQLGEKKKSIPCCGANSDQINHDLNHNLNHDHANELANEHNRDHDLARDKKQLVLDKILLENNAENTDNLKAGLRLNNISGYNSKDKLEFYYARTTTDIFKIVHYFQKENPNKTIQFELHDKNNPEEKLTYSALPIYSGVLPVHPTQIYSSILAFTLCGILLTLGKINWFKFRKGAVTAAFLILYGSVRFCIEIVRTDEEPFYNTGLTIAQNLSIVLITIGLILLIYVTIKKPQNNQANV